MKKLFLPLFVTGIIIVFVIIACIDYNSHYYKCTDIHNNIYYVRHLILRDGGDYIKLDDGTILRVESYKSITKKEYELYQSEK